MGNNAQASGATQFNVIATQTSGITPNVLNIANNPVNNVFALDKNGDVGIAGALAPGFQTQPTLASLWNDGGAVNGLVLNVPTSSTNGISLTVNNVTRGQFSATGDLRVAPLINGTNTLGRVAPGYKLSGASYAGSYHHVSGSLITTLNGTCFAGTQCTLTTSTVTFPATEIFAGNVGVSYFCGIGGIGNTTQSQDLTWSADTGLSSGSVLGFDAVNTTAVNLATLATVGVMFVCDGE
jgi:hypothetical protein